MLGSRIQREAVTKEVAAKLKEEIDELVAIGEEIAHAASSSDNNLGQDYIIKTSMWVGRIGQIIRRLYGSASQHLVNYQKTLSERSFYIMHSNYYSHIGVMAGIIKAIQHEFERGLISDFRRILQADIFADFLEMGEIFLTKATKMLLLLSSVLCWRMHYENWRKLMKSPPSVTLESLLHSNL